MPLQQTVIILNLVSSFDLEGSPDSSIQQMTVVVPKHLELLEPKLHDLED